MDPVVFCLWEGGEGFQDPLYTLKLRRCLSFLLLSNAGDGMSFPTKGIALTQLSGIGALALLLCRCGNRNRSLHLQSQYIFRLAISPDPHLALRLGRQYAVLR